MDIKEEYILSDDVDSQNERELFVTMKRISDDVAIKTEIKSETPFIRHLETVTCSSNWEIDTKTEIEEQTHVSDFVSQKEGEYFPDDPIMKDKKYNVDHEIEIKEEPWWLETKMSSVCDDIMDGDFPPVKSSRFVTEIKKSNNSCEMDLKEEYVLSDDVDSHNEREFFVTMKRDSDDVATNTEIKSETPFTKHLETVTCSSNWEMDMKTEIEEPTHVSDFGSQKEGEFLPEDPVMKDKKYNIDCEIEIKEEPWWLEGKTSAICDDNDGDFPAVKSSRLCTETISGESSGKSSLSSLEISGREISNYNGKDHLVCEHQKGELPTAEKHVLSEQSGKCSDEGEMYIRHLKQKSVIHKGKSAHQCNTCNKSFAYPSYLKTHILIHEGKRPHRCKICAKSFTLLSTLKTHNLIHEGKKPHQCKTCDKSFTQLSTLKTHNLIHEGKKPHQCKTCDKNFSRLSTLRRHNLIHEGKKPYQCKTCEKSFTQLSNLKAHNFTHEDRKPYQCKACDKSFTQLSNLKAHNLIHEFKNQYQCKTCDKSFTQL